MGVSTGVDNTGGKKGKKKEAEKALNTKEQKKAEETAGQKHDGLRKQIGGAIENELVNVMNKALEQSQGNASKDATIVGGFFRDGSMLPQSFYDL